MGNAVVHFEIGGPDDAPLVTFYGELFGWTVGGGDAGAPPSYGMADTGAGSGIQGGLGSSTDARWATIYASVGDVEQTLAKAESLGGSRIYGPMAVDDHMQTGAFRDPAGNVFGVYHHGEH